MNPKHGAWGQANTLRFARVQVNPDHLEKQQPRSTRNARKKPVQKKFIDLGSEIICIRTRKISGTPFAKTARGQANENKSY
jgi:hypothetical protein